MDLQTAIKTICREIKNDLLKVFDVADLWSKSSCVKLSCAIFVVVELR